MYIIWESEQRMISYELYQRAVTWCYYMPYLNSYMIYFITRYTVIYVVDFYDISKLAVTRFGSLKS